MGLFQKIKEVGSKIVEKIKSKFKKPKFDDPFSQKMKINPGPLVGGKHGTNPLSKMTPEQRAEYDKKRAEQMAHIARATTQAMKEAGLVASSK